MVVLFHNEDQLSTDCWPCAIFFFSSLHVIQQSLTFKSERSAATIVRTKEKPIKELFFSLTLQVSQIGHRQDSMCVCYFWHTRPIVSRHVDVSRKSSSRTMFPQLCPSSGKRTLNWRKRLACSIGSTLQRSQRTIGGDHRRLSQENYSRPYWPSMSRKIDGDPSMLVHGENTLAQWLRWLNYVAWNYEGQWYKVIVII